ncbi:MAG: hypothetical protein E7G24_14060 [Clostridium celatum]|nr:hypothetical protein [Clostridium celatum]
MTESVRSDMINFVANDKLQQTLKKLLTVVESSDKIKKSLEVDTENGL